MKIPRILIAAGASGSGKTLLTCGLLQAFVNRGKKIASFKCGPDYIDPMFHRKIIGTKAGNLDSFFVEKEKLRFLMASRCEGMDLAVIEGVMGYYDGLGGILTEGSSYDISRLTETPVIFVVPCRGMSLSVVPYIEGYVNFRHDSRIKGVILNQISPMIYQKVKTAIEEHTGIPVIGYLPDVEECRIESRHLGLIMPEEIENLRERLMRLAALMEQTLDLNLLYAIADSAPPLERPAAPSYLQEKNIAQGKLRIAVAKDQAFCFIYEENLDLLRQMGAEILEFSPLKEEKLPEGTDGLILYGGYPELFARQLAENENLRREIAEKCRQGLPLLAECGGFMYLHDRMEGQDGNFYPGVGLIQGEAYRTERLGRFGYIRLTREKEEFFGGSSQMQEKAQVFPAHEFHYFDSTNPGEGFLAEKPVGGRSWRCLHGSGAMLAGFPHFYYHGNPLLPKTFLEKCKNYQRQKEGAGQ